MNIQLTVNLESEEIPSELLGAIASLGSPAASRPATSPRTDAVTPEVREFVRSKAANREREQLVLACLAAIASRGDVELVPGRESATRPGHVMPYLMVRRPGSYFGAAANIRPRNGRVTLRLSEDDVVGYPHAVRRDVTTDTPYRTAIYLTSPDAVEEAVALINLALDRVAGEG